MRRTHDLVGPAVFVVIAIGLTWALAACLAPVGDAHARTATRLLHASVLYAAVIGWQPLLALAVARRVVDDQRALDRGLRSVRPRYTWIAIAAPLVLLGSAALLDAALSTRAAPTASSASDVADGAQVASVLLAFTGVIAVLWLQAIAEEVAWRGYLLPRLMRRLGPWPGLVLHGLLWGACYAPVLLVGDGASAVPRMASFVVTCALLGVLLGWLRLASRSVLASAASNATLTICAGLPLVLQGTPSPLGAVFEPAGWIPMLLLIALIAAHAPLRRAIAVPERGLPEHVN